jgi:hypothetical protein
MNRPLASKKIPSFFSYQRFTFSAVCVHPERALPGKFVSPRKMQSVTSHPTTSSCVPLFTGFTGLRTEQFYLAYYGGNNIQSVGYSRFSVLSLNKGSDGVLQVIWSLAEDRLMTNLQVVATSIGEVH